MAGDWMKVEKDTPEKPEVMAMATALNRSVADVFLGCFRVWRWADSQTSDGYVKRVTVERLDELSGMPGFGVALSEVGWLHIRSGALELPNFDRHMGQSAKNRALTANRMAKSRDKNSDAQSVTESSPEKRREEKKKDKETPLPPLPFLSDSFKAAWSEWEQHRKEKGIKITPTALARQFKKLAAMGEQRAIAAIEHSVANSYQGIYEPNGSATVPKSEAKKAEFDRVFDEFGKKGQS